MLEYKANRDNSSRFMTLRFHFKKLTWVINVTSVKSTESVYSQQLHEEYELYGSNEFIADVGGFLGLLLGQSIFGIYQFVSGGVDECSCMKRTRRRRQKRLESERK